MANSIVLEKLSNRNLLFLFAGNLVILIILCVAGGKGPRPTNAMHRTTKACNDSKLQFQQKTIPTDDKSCPDIIPSLEEDYPELPGNNLVFFVVLPSDMYSHYTMSRWFQWMITILQIKPLQNSMVKLKDENPTLTFKGAMFGRHNVDEDWTPVHVQDPDVTHNRRLQCWVDKEYDVTHCSDVSLFELGSVFYAQYLVNLQLPQRDGLNNDLPRIAGLEITEIHQNGGFTKVWVAQKSVMCPLLLLATLLFRRQVKRYEIHSPLLITKVITAIGVTNVIFNLPLEYLSLFMDLPELRVWYDCSTGLFYAATAVLWLLFVGEHRMDLDQRNKFSNYWKEITAICVCACVMFLFDVIERGLQISDPFHSIWSTVAGESTARTLILVSAGCAAFYILVLIYLMIRASISMSRKRASLVNVGRVRQMYYEGLITRFKVMVYGTVVCGLLTVIMFIMINVNEMYYKWGRSEKTIEISSGFLVGIAGLWNLYVLNILLLYAPTSSTDKNTEEYDTVEMSEVNTVTGPDALTVLTKPSAD
ncbi:hypothetical protein ACHWQZ_G013245 [Mnemiopsis leidyi]